MFTLIPVGAGNLIPFAIDETKTPTVSSSLFQEKRRTEYIFLMISPCPLKADNEEHSSFTAIRSKRSI